MVYKASTIKAILRSKLPSKKKRILLTLSLIRKQNAPHRRLPRHMFRRNRGFAIDEMARLPDGIFRRMFRVDRPTFTELVQQLSTCLKKFRSSDLEHQQYGLRMFSYDENIRNFVYMILGFLTSIA